MVDTQSVKRWPEGRVATLQARKQALQEQLAARNEELRRLCIQEAELTGTMPPELPLEPGESPPTFRRVVGTGYSYSQNLINKVKPNDVESIAALELEKQVQAGISEAALGLVHNGAASKAVRRKNRQVYQQSQRRLSELEERLGFLMASRKTNEFQQQPVAAVSSPPQVPPHVRHSQPLPLAHTHSVPSVSKANLHQHQYVDDNIALLHSQMQQMHRQSPHHGLHQTNHVHHHHTTTKYKKKPRPATIDVDKTHRSHLPYDDNHSGHYSTHSSNSDHTCMLPPVTHERLERTVSAVHPRQVTLAPHQQYDSGLGGNWVCLDNGETVWCSVETNYWSRESRFGSLDRSKARPLQHKWNTHATVDSRDLHKNSEKISQDLSRNSTSRLPSCQEIFNVEKSSTAGDNWSISQTVSLSNMPINPDSSPVYRDNTTIRKNKQKKWQETSLDGPVTIEKSSPGPNFYHSGSLESMLPVQPPPYRHLASPMPSLRLAKQPPSVSPSKDPSPVTISSTPPPLPPTSQVSLPPPIPPPSRLPPPIDINPELPLSPYNNNNNSSNNNNNNNNNTVLVQSPKNCTVIQPGQWKPYREVTKPFEMSDFYKYSTKFRNRNLSGPDDKNLEKTIKSDDVDESNDNGVDVPDSAPPLYHKGIYTPLQPMKCQPFHHTNNSSMHLNETLPSSEVSRKMYHPSESSPSHPPRNSYRDSSQHHNYNVHRNLKNNSPLTTSTLV